MRTLSLTISPTQAGRTIRSLLKNELRLSTRAVSRLTRRETGILLNGVRAFTIALVAEGDVLTAEIGDETPADCIAPLDIPLDILYEDADLLVLNKAAGMAVHASSFLPDTPTVAGALAAYWGGNFVFHAVNRLDKGTTGVMLVAKSGYIHELLQQSLHSAALTREYRAVVMGLPHPPHGRIDAPIGRVDGSAIQRQVTADGAPACTLYETLESNAHFSLLRLLPQSGRTHQLRVHLSSLGYPLVGDWLYGTEDETLISRPALHALSLAFTHPITGKPLFFTAPLPADIQKLMNDQEVPLC